MERENWKSKTQILLQTLSEKKRKTRIRILYPVHTFEIIADQNVFQMSKFKEKCMFMNSEHIHVQVLYLGI